MSPSPRINYDEVNEYIRNSTPESVILLGCDSVRIKKRKGWNARYSTVVVIRNATGSGKDLVYRGCKVFGGSCTLPDYGRVIRSGKLANLKLRLMQEVTFVLEAFENVWEAIGDRHFEIHLDINTRPECESNIALTEARGYVMGMTGYEPEFKPDALAASFAADAYVHGLIH